MKKFFKTTASKVVENPEERTIVIKKRIYKFY